VLDRSEVEALAIPGEILAHHALELLPLPHPGALPEVEQEPQLEARVRDGQQDAVVPGHLTGIGELRMLVAIEDAPRLVVPEKRLALGTSCVSSRLRLIASLLDKVPGVAVARWNIYLDRGVAGPPFEAADIGALGDAAFADDE
jgi:hypothetical protein